MSATDIGRKAGRRKGYSLIFVMVVMVTILAAVTIITAFTQQNLYTAMLQQINTNAYYVARQAADLTVNALMTVNNDLTGAKLIENFTDKLTVVPVDLSAPDKGLILYDAYGNKAGEVQITLKRSVSEGENWCSAYIKTRTEDNRIPRTESDIYEFYYLLNVLVEDTDVRTFSVIDENAYVSGLAKDPGWD